MCHLMVITLTSDFLLLNSKILTPTVLPMKVNVTLFCDVVSGSPSQLLQVQWFMDGMLLNSLPQCGPRAELCDVDPSKLLLENVNRHFSGHFSCTGLTSAGSSQMSPPLLLEVRVLRSIV